MAPPYKNKSGLNNDRWWDNAYANDSRISVEYQYVDGQDVIEPGMVIRFKYERGTFKFRCVAHNIELGTNWMDALDTDSGEWRSFRIEKFKGVVKPRKRRKVLRNAAIPAI